MIVALDEVESTNDLALAAAKTGTHGDCWIAESQTKGRGRREIGGPRRNWYSPPGRNIYMSVLLKPTIEPARAAGLTLAAGVAVCETLKSVIGAKVWLKWPNDIFVGTHKLGGILTEALSSGTRLDGVVVGLGLNVNVLENEIPEDLQDIMTSLAVQNGELVDRLSLVHPLRAAILFWADQYVSQGWPGLEQAIGRWDDSAGKRVEVLDGTGRAGVALGIDPQGQLRVELSDGQTVALSTGEVKLIV